MEAMDSSGRHPVPCCERAGTVPRSPPSSNWIPSNPTIVSTQDTQPCESTDVKLESTLDSSGQRGAASGTLEAEAELVGDPPEKMKGPKEGKAAWPKSPVHTQGPEKLVQSPLVSRSDSECSACEVAQLSTVEKCLEAPPQCMDAPPPQEDPAVGNRCSKNNGGLAASERFKELKAHSPLKEKVCTPPKIDKEHYCTKRDRSESEEREASRNQADGHYSYKKKRCPYSRERAKQESYRRDSCSGSKYRLRSSPDSGRSLGKYPHSRSLGKGKADLERNRYCYWKAEPSWNREMHYQESQRRWEKGRSNHYENYDYSHVARNSQDRKFSYGERDYSKSSHVYNKSYQDYYYKSRWTRDPAAKERARYRATVSQGDLYHRCPSPSQRLEKYPTESSTPVLEENSLHVDASCLKYESVKERKRKCPGPENCGSSDPERKHSKTAQGEFLEEQTGRKPKKAKKKKKAKDKHRERDCR